MPDPQREACSTNTDKGADSASQPATRRSTSKRRWHSTYGEARRTPTARPSSGCPNVRSGAATSISSVCCVIWTEKESGTARPSVRPTRPPWSANPRRRTHRPCRRFLAVPARRHSRTTPPAYSAADDQGYDDERLELPVAQRGRGKLGARLRGAWRQRRYRDLRRQRMTSANHGHANVSPRQLP